MASTEKRYVIAGASAAGMAAAEAIRALDKRGSIIVFSDEPDPPYFRPLIPFLISGKKCAADMAMSGEGPYSGAGIDVRLNTRVERIDTRAQTVCLPRWGAGCLRQAADRNGQSIVRPA